MHGGEKEPGRGPTPTPNRGLAGRVVSPLGGATQGGKHGAQLKSWDEERMKDQREKEIRKPGNGCEDSQRGEVSGSAASRRHS